jgi:hypothetical protein
VYVRRARGSLPYRLVIGWRRIIVLVSLPRGCGHGLLRCAGYRMRSDPDLGGIYCVFGLGMCGPSPCSLGLSVTSQHYFSLITN